MRPYYDDGTVTIYHGNCLDVMADGGPIGRGYVVITDPPYGFGAYPTDTQVFDSSLMRLWRIEHQTVAVFGYPEQLVRWCAGMEPDEWVTWWATNAITGRHGGLNRETECIAIYGACPGLGALVEPRSASSQQIAADHDSAKDKGHRRMGDVWRDVKPGMAFNAHQRQHPNEKPMTLMRRLVQMCSDPGDVIFDPFCGSGTTLRAAKDLGRRAIGIEIDETHCATAVRRLGQGVLDVAA